MIVEFNEYNNLQYIINLDELWLTYLQNFEEIYPDSGIRNINKDIKTIGHHFSYDINEILTGKDVEISRKLKGEIIQVRNVIVDVRATYMKNLQNNKLLNWSYQVTVKGDRRWILLKDKIVKVFSTHKTKLESDIDLISSTKKYNL